MESGKIFVFPCVSREIKNEKGETLANEELKAKLMSEENITNIIKSITDNTSYVINDDLENLEFIIDGYYFKLINYQLTGTQYAYININDGSVGKLLKGDNATTFEGLVITDNKNDVEGKNYLTLCVDNKVPNSSKIKFQLKSLPLNIIDCGELK